MTILDHREMLIDSPRMLAYKDAIEKSVKQGMTICDLGCGSGVMGLLALKAGAGKVYGIEQSDVIEQAELLAEENGCADEFICIKGFSTEITLPEKVDLIIVENLTTLGAGAEEMQLANIEDAVKRFLKPNGKIIPKMVDHLVVPVCDSHNWYNYIGSFDTDYYGLDFSCIRKLASSRPYKTRSNPDGFLAEPLSWLRVDHLDSSTHVASEHFEGNKVCFRISSNEICHGLAAWFDCELAENIRLNNSPQGPETHWKNFFFPVEKPFEVKKEDELLVEIGLRHVGREADFFWFVEHMRNGELMGRHGSPGFSSQTLQVDDFARISGRFVPLKNNKDTIEEILLSLVDNRKTALEVSQAAHNKYPEIFETSEKALVELIDLWRNKSLKII